MKKFIIWLSIGCIPVYGFWVFPTLEDTRRASVRLKTQTAEIQAQTEKLKTLEALQKNMKTDEAEFMIKKIPATSRQELIIMELQKISQETEFSFRALDFSKKQDTDHNIPQILINFSIRGPKSKLPDFLEKLEQGDRFFGLETVNFETSELNGVSVIVANLSVHTFSLE